MDSNGSLNHVYRTVWNLALGAMVAVAEITGSRRKSPSLSRSASPACSQRLRTALTALSLAALCWATPGALLANPMGGVAVQGQATFTSNGNNLLVNTQNGAGQNHSVINWQSFSIPAGSSTYFQQPTVSSTSINRVVTNNPSLIFGALGSNGSLVLVNQSGITVGAGAVVDTAGFTAAAMRMTDADALAGRMRFGDATSAAGSVSVQGNVLARSGDVLLLGSRVDTGGTALVQAPNGSTILGAGQQIEITGRGLEGIVMQVQAPADSAINLGSLQGDAVGIFAGTLKHSGQIQATQVSVEGGKIVLKASGDALVQDNAQTLATSAVGKGGVIEVLGARVGVTDNAVIDASGATGGGTVLVGGDYQGKNAAIPNATVSYTGPQTSIKADATGSGNGGKVIVWADDTTRAYGSISAQGGAAGGDGGLVETSGHRYLDAAGARVNTLAPLGQTGNWLLDPTDITIVHGNSLGGLFDLVTGLFTGVGGTTATLNDGDINLQMYSTNITVQTSSAAAATGNMVFDSNVSGAIAINNISTGGARALNLSADGNIIFRGTNGTTFASTAAQITVTLNPAAKVVTEAGSSVTLSGSSTPALLRLPMGKTWDNLGTLNINGNASVQLETSAAFNNKVGGVTNVASTNGFAFTSPSSNPSLDDGIVNNDGTMNVTANTAFEAEYNQTGTLNINNSALNLQNVNSVSGTIDLAPAGAQYASELSVTEKHGHTANFNNLAIQRTGNVLTANGNDPRLNIGTMSSAVDATFTNVTAPLVDLHVGPGASPPGSNGSSATVLNGASDFLALNAPYAAFGFDNGTLGLHAPVGLMLSTSGPMTFAGNVGLYTAGPITVDRSISTTGNLRLISGWNGDMTTPAAVSTFRQIATPLTVSSALSANNLNLESSDGLVLNAALTASGTFDARARSGDIAPTSTLPPTFPLHITGSSKFVASGQVNLADTANTFAGLEVDAGSSVNVVAASGLSLGNITGSSVTLDATGAITQSSGTITALASSHLNAGKGGSVNVYGSTVSLGTVLANGVTYCPDNCGDGGAGGDVLIQARTGGFSGTIQSTGGAADNFFGGNGGSGGTVTVVAAGGTTALSPTTFSLAGGAFSSGNSGTFVGTNGAAGRWLVYAAAPSNVSKGGLTSDFRHYNATYANYQGRLVTETGNGFIYASAPGALKVDTTLLSGTASNTYGVTPDAVFGYTLSGFADGEDTADNIGRTGTALFDHSFLPYTNAGSYVQKYASGLSSALGYTFAAQNGVAYTVNQRPITVSTSAVTKTYDGNTTALGTPVVIGGTLFGNDVLSAGTYAFTNRNAGTGNKTVNVSGVTVTDGNSGGNYLVSYTANTASTIAPLSVTLTAPVVSKTYDGTTAYATQTADLASLGSALVAGDSVAAATLMYSNKNAGTANKVVDLTSVTVNDGNAGNNYAITLVGNRSSTIIPAAITLTAPVVSKTYDGSTAYTTTSANLASLSGALASGDAVSAATLQYADKNNGVGNKAVTLNSVTVNDGNGGANYTVTLAGNSVSTIAQAPLATWIGGSTGLWSQASNWTALPDSNNVLAVSIPSGTTVTLDSTATAISLQNLNSLGTLAVTGSNLAITSALVTSQFSQTGGTVHGAGTFTASSGFNQTGGGIAMDGAVVARQASGNLAVTNVQGGSITLGAATGAVSQFGGLATAGLLSVSAGNGINLSSTANTVSAFAASTTGSGNVRLVNTGALDVQGVTVANGNVAIDNTGAFRNSGSIVARGGTVDIKTHSPLTINSSVVAGGNITLAALTPDGTSNITINSPMTSSAGGISIQAYNNFIQNAGLSAALAIDVSTISGSLLFGPSAFSVGNPVSYAANGVSYTPPWVAATLSGGATDYVATFLDQFQAAIDAQTATIDDPLGLALRGREGVVVEGQICKP